jgi:hypothetical protein
MKPCSRSFRLVWLGGSPAVFGTVTAHEVGYGWELRAYNSARRKLPDGSTDLDNQTVSILSDE